MLPALSSDNPLPSEPKILKAKALEWLQVRQLPKRIALSDLYLYSHVLTADMMRKYYRLE